MAAGIDITSLSLFCLVASITPGPNNVLVMRSGARFGVLPTAPHVIGIAAGMIGLIALSSLGVGAVLVALPALFDVLRWACFAYLLWLAWRVLRDTGTPSGEPARDERPMSLAEGALFQLVNPKAWMMAVTSVTAFSDGARTDAAALSSAVAASGCVLLIGTPCVFVWALWGAAIQRALQRPGARHRFNLAMAAAVAVSAVLALEK